MPQTRDLRQFSTPIGPLRDKRAVTIGTDDFELPSGFICQVGSVGDITYRALFGENDQTETGLTAGTVIGIENHPVLLSVVRGSSTVTSIIIGTL